MSTKIINYIINNLRKCLICFISFFILFVVTISILPIVIVEIIICCLALLLIILLIVSSLKEKKEKLEFEKENKEYYEKKWKKYIDLVDKMANEKMYNKDNLDKDWILIFNEILYDVATNQYLFRRMFNDFDIASCLIYSLTLNNDTDENILFAFECAKKIISEPKEYTINLGYGYKLELKEENSFEKLDVCVPDEIITSKAIVEIIHTYIMQKTEDGVVKLSDFLYILYLRCK